MFKYIEAAWNAYRKNYLPLISAFLVILGATFLISFLGFVVIASLGGMDVLSQEITYIVTATENIALNPADTSPLAMLTPYSLVFLLFVTLSVFVGVGLYAGYIGMLDESLKGKTSLSIGKKTTLFEMAKKRGKATIGVTLLIYFIIWTTTLVLYKLLTTLIGPGWQFALTPMISLTIEDIATAYLIIITTFLYLGIPATVIDKLNPRRAVSKSINIVRNNFLSFFFIIFFYSLVLSLLEEISLLGSILNLFLVVHLLKLSVVKFYRDKK